MEAMIGMYSHVFLDSFIHAQMHPLVRFSDANPLLGVISIDNLYLLCIGFGRFGAVGFLAMALCRKHHL
jgi:membrane-bound metal-dependent hydrolase YbcI (DUF457 family)